MAECIWLFYRHFYLRAPRAILRFFLESSASSKIVSRKGVRFWSIHILSLIKIRLKVSEKKQIRIRNCEKSVFNLINQFKYMIQQFDATQMV